MKFAITGVAGYIAPRHLKAIKDTGNKLVAALDPHDSVGILDTYFPEAHFFTEFERFDRHLDKLRRAGNSQGIDYLSICSPNYLHDAHIRLALRLGAHAICEKPLVLNPQNIDALKELERESGKKIFTVLQLRTHPKIKELKEKISSQPMTKKHEVSLSYVTSRGAWYLHSWKGDMEKSGGLVTNIGIHFFDMLIWLFGKVTASELFISTPTKAAGQLELEHATVRWALSIDGNYLPNSSKEKNKSTFRSIIFDGQEVEFSDGFTDLHTLVYQDILSGGGYGTDDALPAIQLAHEIRTAHQTKSANTFRLVT